MKFQALSTFVIFNGQMNVFNTGDEGELPAELVQPYIDGGKAVAIAEVADDSELADDAAALAEMTGAPVGDGQDDPAADEPDAPDEPADDAPPAEPEAPPPAAPAKKGK
jgi:septal ring-binding cell division protein DamX